MDSRVPLPGVFGGERIVIGDLPHGGLLAAPLPVASLAQKVVVRDAAGKPAALSGCTQGRSEILDPGGNMIFEGRYYDTRSAVRDTQRIYTLLRSAGRELRLQPKTIATSLVGNGETLDRSPRWPRRKRHHEA